MHEAVVPSPAHVRRTDIAVVVQELDGAVVVTGVNAKRSLKEIIATLPGLDDLDLATLADGVALEFQKRIDKASLK